MSIFEDTLEVWWNATNTVEGPRELDTLGTALSRVSFPPEEVSIVLDWDSAHEISDQLDVTVPLDDQVVREHVELATQRIGLALGVRATIHGVNSGQPYGLVVNPHSVRYDNSIAHAPGVVAIEWTE
jgi:hypothetical protein